jgi:uncharacterized membrane protein
MQHLKRLLTQPLNPPAKPVRKWVLVFLVIVASVGFADATYLTVEHYTNANPPCYIGSCELVLTSAFSTVAGIPVALGGALYYLCILILLIIFLDSKKEIVLRVALFGTTVGFAASLYFFILQAFVLHAFCQYCLGSATTSTILFITAICIIVRSRKQQLLIS